MRRRYKRRKRHYGLERRGRLQDKPMIGDGPACVEDPQEVGYYEDDTVHGANCEKTCVVMVAERDTDFLLVGTSPDKTVESVSKVLIKLLRESPFPAYALTFDN